MADRVGAPRRPSGLERFALTCAEALAGEVAVLKPQSAFFERHGSAGIRVLERLLVAIHAAARSACWTSSGATSGRR